LVAPASHPAVFLDRDGVLNAARVLNGVPHPPATSAELRLLPHVAATCRQLREAGLRLIVVTNQPDIARGTTTREAVDMINSALRSRVPLDDVIVCPHDDADDCPCRKPRPGMLLAASERHHIDRSRSVMIGDRWRDIAAGHAAGVATVFIDRGYNERPPDDPDLVVRGLHEATSFILIRSETRTLKTCQ
jgi:D-glycero-D-manno-heptose 1,7-bisphosphate phosphatase